jgi:ribosomal protein L10
VEPNNTITLSAAAAACAVSCATALLGKVAALHSFADAMDGARSSVGDDGIVTMAVATVAHVDAVATAVSAAINTRSGLPTGTIKAARKTLANYASAHRTAAERGVSYRDGKGQPLGYAELLRRNTTADPAEKAAAEAAEAAAKAQAKADEEAAEAAAALIAQSIKDAEAASAAQAQELADLRAERDALAAALAAMTAERDALAAALAAQTTAQASKRASKRAAATA